MIRILNDTKYPLITIIIALFISINDNSFCINTPIAIPSDDTLKYNFDIINLMSDYSDLSRIDLYVKINYDELQFLKTKDDKFRAEYEISVIFYDEFGQQFHKKIWQEEVITNNIDEINSTRRSKLSKATFNFPPGEYKVFLEVQDLETRKMAHREIPITLRNYATHDLAAT